MKPIWIFGDSYAMDAEVDYSWPTRLSKTHNVKNFAEGGTGPDWSVNLLKDEIKNTPIEDLKDITLIFFVSHYSRKHFNFQQQASDQCFMAHYAAGSTSGFSQRMKDYYKPFKKFIHQTYKYDSLLHDNEGNFTLQHILLIKELSRFFKQTLIVPVFTPIKDTILGQKFSATILDTDNCTIADSCIWEPEKDINLLEPNHHCRENHAIIYNMMYDWIEKKNPFIINKLKKIS